MVLVGGMDTAWRLGGGRMSEKSSLLSDVLHPHHQRTCQPQLVAGM